IAEIFLASTLESNRWEHNWYVLDVAKDGKLRPYDGALMFRFAMPFVENGQTLLLNTFFDKERFRLGDDNPYRISRHFFNFPEIKETISYVNEEEANKLQPTDLKQVPKLQAILLADYLTNSDAKWSDVTEI